MSDPSGATNGDWDPEPDWAAWCTNECPEDCMADHRGEQ